MLLLQHSKRLDGLKIKNALQNSDVAIVAADKTKIDRIFFARNGKKAGKKFAILWLWEKCNFFVCFSYHYTTELNLIEKKKTKRMCDGIVICIKFYSMYKYNENDVCLWKFDQKKVFERTKKILFRFKKKIDLTIWFSIIFSISFVFFCRKFSIDIFFSFVFSLKISFSHE